MLRSCPRRREDDVTTVGSPRGILVAPLTRVLLHASVAKREGVQLKPAVGLLRLIRDQASIGRPVGVRAVVLVSELVRRQELRVGSVGVANIYLRVAETTRRERESSSVRTERRTRVVGAAADGDAARGATLECRRREEVRAGLLAVRIHDDGTVRREHRGAVQPAADRRDLACAASREIVDVDLTATSRPYERIREMRPFRMPAR